MYVYIYTYLYINIFIHIFMYICIYIHRFLDHAWFKIYTYIILSDFFYNIVRPLLAK